LLNDSLQLIPVDLLLTSAEPVVDRYHGVVRQRRDVMQILLHRVPLFE